MKKIKHIFFYSFICCSSLLFAQDKATEPTNIKVGKFDVQYMMKGRTIINQPKVDIMTEEHGTVVVDIVIDKYGHVVSATPEQREAPPKASTC